MAMARRSWSLFSSVPGSKYTGPDGSGISEMAQERQAKKLWIGNLDPRVTEYQLVQILKKYGEISSFDFLFHRNGPSKGEPKGFCFAEFKNHEDAINAKRNLNGKLIWAKVITVSWAHDKPICSIAKEKNGATNQDCDKNKGIRKTPSRQAQMNAIEHKLKSLEEGKEPSSSKHPILLRQEAAQKTAALQPKRSLKNKGKTRAKPYQR